VVAKTLRIKVYGWRWEPDVAVREDECRVWSRHVAEHLSLLRRHALTLLKRSLAATVGRPNRLLCGWEETGLARGHTADGDCPEATPCVPLRTGDLLHAGRLTTLMHGPIPREAWSRSSWL
jgi:hypothetical protein